MNIVIIAALASNRVIGVDNTLPWKLSADLKRFKALTTGHDVVMGRKTFESLGRPLPGRRHICVSRQYSTTSLQPDPRWPEQVFWCGELHAALQIVARENKANPQARVFVIGGAEIYRQSLPWADTLELTHVSKHYEGDAHFPYFESLFEKTAETIAKEGDIEFAFATYSSLRPRGVVLRRAELVDAEFIVDAQVKMAWESEGLKLEADRVTSGVHAVFSNPHKGEYWVAERSEADNKKPIACLLLQKEWSDWRNGWFNWIHSLYVQPHERRKGVCRWMLKCMRENARTHSALGLRLYVDKNNQTARQSYLNFGMTGGHYDLFEVEF